MLANLSVEDVDFKEIDKEFINIDRITDDSFMYRAKEVLVQSSWELPIVVQYPGSTIKFEFSTTMGDIVFGIMFIPALEDGQAEEDMRAETIDEMGRVLSDIEPYGGVFTPRCEGVVFFIWDNTHDWYSNKKVSYTIDLQQVDVHINMYTCIDLCGPIGIRGSACVVYYMHACVIPTLALTLIRA